jgi:hypothetical protein
MTQYVVEYFSLYRKKWVNYVEINHGDQKASYPTQAMAERRMAHLKSVWPASSQFRITEVAGDEE